MLNPSIEVRNNTIFIVLSLKARLFAASEGKSDNPSERVAFQI